MASCFICNGPHHARDCPRRGKLLALMATDAKGDSNSDESTVQVDPLQWLNVLHPKGFIHNELMDVPLLVNGKRGNAMVDSGVNHNFVASKVATEFGLNLEKDGCKIKAMNSRATQINGIAKKVHF